MPKIIESSMPDDKKEDSIYSKILESSMVTPEVQHQLGNHKILASAIPERHETPDVLKVHEPKPKTGFSLGVVGYPGSHLAKSLSDDKPMPKRKYKMANH